MRRHRHRKPRGQPLDGWLVVDKPTGIGSTDVVNKVKRAFDAQKAGHGGTLDPLATGVLPVAFGAAAAAPRLSGHGIRTLRKWNGRGPRRRRARNTPEPGAAQAAATVSVS